MTKRLLVAAALAATALGGGTASAYDPDPIIRLVMDPDPIVHVAVAKCSGQYDAACMDNTNAFCTLWMNWRCTVGE